MASKISNPLFFFLLIVFFLFLFLWKNTMNRRKKNRKRIINWCQHHFVHHNSFFNLDQFSILISFSYWTTIWLTLDEREKKSQSVVQRKCKMEDQDKNLRNYDTIVDSYFSYFWLSFLLIDEWAIDGMVLKDRAQLSINHWLTLSKEKRESQKRKIIVIVCFLFSFIRNEN